MDTSAFTSSLLAAKAGTAHTFGTLGAALGRDEVAVAALFFGQAAASPADLDVLARELALPREQLRAQYAVPHRGSATEMPPREPLIYRLYEIVQTYGLAYKAVLNEKFGDGIMSAIAFTTKVDKEVDAQGAEWAVITLRGKW